MRRGHGLRRRAAALVAAAGVALPTAAALTPAPAAAAGAGDVPFLVGIGDQSPGVFADPRFTGLNAGAVRVIVPWDVETDGEAGAPARAVLAAAAGQDRRVLVAIDHARGVDCRKVSPCPAPTPAAYGAAFAALVARYPRVEAWTPWNEPNHASEPTASRPELAAAYYGAARAACPACTLVAGDVLDAGDLRGWWTAYAAALSEAPAVVGLHDYYDATYFSSDGVDTMLGLIGSAQLWLTEVGGIVRFSPGGHDALPYDEQRAADAIRWTLTLPLDRPRVTRVYLFSWSSSPAGDFDAGLIGYDGEARPGYRVVADTVGLRSDATPTERAAVTAAGAGGAPGSAATAPRAGGPPVLRLAGRAVVLRGRTLRIGVACPAPAPCSALLTVLGHRRAVGVGALGARTVTVRLGPAGLAAVRRRWRVRVRISPLGAPASTVTLPVHRRARRL